MRIFLSICIDSWFMNETCGRLGFRGGWRKSPTLERMSRSHLCQRGSLSPPLWGFLAEFAAANVDHFLGPEERLLAPYLPGSQTSLNRTQPMRCRLIERWP